MRVSCLDQLSSERCRTVRLLRDAGHWWWEHLGGSWEWRVWVAFERIGTQEVWINALPIKSEWRIKKDHRTKVWKYVKFLGRRLLVINFGIKQSRWYKNSGCKRRKVRKNFPSFATWIFVSSVFVTSLVMSAFNSFAACGICFSIVFFTKSFINCSVSPSRRSDKDLLNQFLRKFTTLKRMGIKFSFLNTSISISRKFNENSWKSSYLLAWACEIEDEEVEKVLGALSLGDTWAGNWEVGGDRVFFRVSDVELIFRSLHHEERKYHFLFLL